MAAETDGAGDLRVAVISGASRGIGFETARAFLNGGWSVCVTGRREANLSEAATALAASPDRLLAIPGAAPDESHQKEVVDRVLERWGRIDALVNNAATSPFLGDLIDAERQHLERGMEVNLVAPWSWTREVVRSSMLETGGSVVNMASIGGTYPVPRVGVYNVTKAALIHLTRQLALELAPQIRVNAVAPATIKTDFSRAKYEGREQEVAEQYPLRRLGTAREVADLAVSLCDGRLEWVTGQTYVLDGGASLIQGVR